jgi:hypothetical protein
MSKPVSMPPGDTRCYRSETLSFEAPPDWRKRTVIAYAGEPDPWSELAPNLVVIQETLEREASPHLFFRRQLLDLSRSGEDFELLDARERTVAGLPATQFRCTYSAKGQVLEQCAVCVQVRVTSRGIDVVTFTATRHLEADGAMDLARVLEGVLESVRLAAGSSEGSTEKQPAADRDGLTVLPPMPGFGNVAR